jgi:hypothetical protein
LPHQRTRINSLFGHDAGTLDAEAAVAALEAD